MKFTHAIFMAVLIYHLSIGYYTAYGVYKSYSEYFCTQKRADSPDYVQLFQSDIIDFSRISGVTVIKDSIIARSSGLYGVKNIGENHFNSTYKYIDNGFNIDLNYNYKVKESYFNLNCSIIKNLNFIEVNSGGGEYVVSNMMIYYADIDGYLREKRFEKGLIIMNSGHNSSSQDPLRSFSCTMRKSPETCELSIESKNKFYVTYLIIIVSMVFITIMSFFGVENFKILRMIKYVNDKFHFNPQSTLRFCNPITGNPMYLKSFNTINIITNERYEKPSCRTIKSFIDLDGKYTLLEDCILIESVNKRECIEANESDIKILSEYFFEVTLDPSLCVVSENESHFLKTIDVIYRVCSGKGITKSLKKNDGFVLDVHEFELKLIRKNYSSLNIELCKFLLEHNWRFFSGKYNMDALLSSLRKKTWFYNRPKSVNNSQWKWYTSDFKIILSKYNFKSNCQVNWYPSVALKSLENVDWGNFEVIKIAKTVYKELNKNFLGKSNKRIADELSDLSLKINTSDVFGPMKSKGVCYTSSMKSPIEDDKNSYMNSLKNYRDSYYGLVNYNDHLERRGIKGEKEEFFEMAKEIRSKIFDYRRVSLEEKEVLENPIYGPSHREIKGRYGRVRIVKQKPEMTPVHSEIISDRSTTLELMRNKAVDIAYLINVYKKVAEYEKSLEGRTKSKGGELNVQNLLNKSIFEKKIYNKKNRNKNKNNNKRNTSRKKSGVNDEEKVKIKRENIFMPKSFITNNFSNCIKALDDRNSNITFNVRQKTYVKLNILLNKNLLEMLKIKNKDFSPDFSTEFKDLHEKLYNRLDRILLKNKDWKFNVETWEDFYKGLDIIIKMINFLFD